MDEHDYKSLIQYFGREKFYQSMQNCSLEAITKFPGENTFRLYNGFALVLGNRMHEGIRELNPLQYEKDLSMASIIALMYAHKRCTVIDKEALIQLDSRLKEEKKKLNSNSAFYAAVFLFHCHKVEKAKEYAEKSLKYDPENYDAIVLKGWAELTTGSRINSRILELFERALSFGKNIDAILGEIRYHQLNNDFETAISLLNRLSVRYPELIIPLVEKMKTQLANWNWEHAIETSYRILNLEPANIEALRVKLLVIMCRDGNYPGSLGAIQMLYSAIDKYESGNSELFYCVGQLFSRVCGRNEAVLEETLRFIERASVLSPNNADYITELGHHAVLLGRLSQATKYFRSATKLDDSAIDALCGLTLCQIIESGPSEQVNQQIEFLNELQGNTKIPLLLLMSSKLSAKAPDKAISLLVECCEIQFRNLKTLAYGPEYLRKFDPDFLLQVTNQLLNYAPIQASGNANIPTLVKENLHISLKHSLNILEAVVKACPGLVQGVYQLARVQFLSGEISKSAQTLQKIITELDPTYTDAHLLIAQIHIQSKSYQRALQNLEVCLSHNFNVRENPLYHLLQGVVYKSQQSYEQSLRAFLQAINLTKMTVETTGKVQPGKLGGSSPSKRNKKITETTTELSLANRVTLYLEIIDVYTVTEQSAEATKWMQTAIEEFSSTPEGDRLTIANAELFLQQGNVNRCIDLLQRIKPEQPYYLQAKTKMADVYLHQRKDRLGFAQCYKELVDHCPGSESFLMLGDAYMSIQGMLCLDFG